MTTKRKVPTAPAAEALRKEKIEFAFRFSVLLIEGLIEKIRARGAGRGMEPAAIERAVASFRQDVIQVLREIRGA